MLWVPSEELLKKEKVKKKGRKEDCTTYPDYPHQHLEINLSKMHIELEPQFDPKIQHKKARCSGVCL